MVNESPKSERKLPPYVSYVTFVGFIESLNSSVVPPKIDSSLMANRSGAIQSQIMGALRFLGLITESGATQDSLRRLVSAYGTDEWAEAVSNEILPAYLPLVGDMDTDTATWKELQDAFRDRAGAEGSVLQKSLRFFTKAMDEAGWTYSPHFKKTRGGKAGAGRSNSSTRRKRTTKKKTDENPAPPKGMIELQIPFRGRPTGRLIVPTDFSEADVPTVEAVLVLAKMYAQQEGGSDDDD